MVYFSGLFRYGQEAVLFFFVLSGFVIHLRYARQLAQAGGAETTFGWGKYLWRRSKRLYPPLVAALALTFLLDTAGRSFGYAIYAQSTPYSLINQNVVSHLGWKTLLGNFAFLMNTYVPCWGTNGPLWSLKFEWWFYMIYPIFWLASRRSKLLATALMVLFFLGSFFPGLWPMRLLSDVFSAMLMWWLGALLADLYTGRLCWPWRSVALGCLVIGAAGMLIRAGQWHQLAVALAVTGFLAGCFELERRGYRLGLLVRCKPVGDMSYTLYVTHFPILVLASGWLMSRSSIGALPRHFGWAVLSIPVCLGLAYALHFVVERPFVTRRRARLPAASPG